MSRRKLPGGIWEYLGPGPAYPADQPYPPPTPQAPRPAPRASGRPRGLTSAMLTRARRIARADPAPRCRRVAAAVLEHASVSSAAEALGIPIHQVYEALRSRA